MACRQILLLSANLLCLQHFLDLWSCTSPNLSLISMWLYGCQYTKKPQSTPWLMLQRVLGGGGRDVHCCAKLWAISQFILHLRSVTCPGCGIPAPFETCQLKQHLQHTSLPTSPIFQVCCKSCSVPPHSQHRSFYGSESYWDDSWPLRYRCCAGW